KTVKGKLPQDINPDTDLNFYPVFIKKINGQVEGYAVPVSGKGLWSTIYGYFAVDPDGKTVKGLTFYKHGETPGLGGELEKQWFRDNFIGKKFIDKNDNLVGIQIVKGKVDDYSENAFHQVDGISGATMTAKGINIFLLKNLQDYEEFFAEVRAGRGFQ
ncbi:MAG: NADH:ubiquinone reductase (Na(+)-transporting) subunit C, partial [Candidatus Neomarinimicrobiota bacterium]